MIETAGGAADPQGSRKGNTVNVLRTDKIITMLQRALNLVDERLVDHGMRVAMLVNAMLDAEGVTDPPLRKELCILALLHDIGAYRTDEIDRMVVFETEDIWEHSIYGYLVLREFTPLKGKAEVVLYHHANASMLVGLSESLVHFAQIFHVADRVDVFWANARGHKRQSLKRLLRERHGSCFQPEITSLFWEADRKYGLLERLEQPVELTEILDTGQISYEEAVAYLKLLVHIIDFRSHHTVTHTVNTTQISSQLARRMGLTEEQVKRVYYGAMLHDLGKIGTPLEILEKPGRLTAEEMEVMRGHVELTRRIIDGCVEPEIARIALHHHEKLDGSGYPKGLKARELTMEDRIVAVGDIISALCGSRSYKDAFPKEKVVAILDNMVREGQLDQAVAAKAETEFDGILEEARRVGRPIMEAYEQIGEEYAALLARFKGPAAG